VVNEVGEQVRVSRKYQVVIPKSAREQAKIKPGQTMTAIVKHGMVTLVPVLSIEELQELCRGVDIDWYREEVDQD
jgi:AbrB family looped-hinge helix DNA binding protein